jgi:hypothetical protein
MAQAAGFEEKYCDVEHIYCSVKPVPIQQRSHRSSGYVERLVINVRGFGF